MASTGMHPGFLDKVFRVIGKRNSVYCAVVVVGALVGEKVVSNGFDNLWNSHNRGKLFEDIPVLGMRAEEAAAESTSDSAAESTSDSAAESTSDSAAESTSDSAAESRSDSAAESTSE